MSQPSTFRVLGAGECLDHLAASPVGRVAWCGPRGPTVVPVSIAFREGCVVFRTAAYSQLARSIRDATVAIEVDEIEPADRRGWSVLVVGRAEMVVDPGELTMLWHDDPPEPWADGVRSLFVRVRPARITGRQVGSR